MVTARFAHHPRRGAGMVWHIYSLRLSRPDGNPRDWMRLDRVRVRPFRALRLSYHERRLLI
jgi:hypothetical protein